MNIVNEVLFKKGSKEENLEEITEKFPYTCQKTDLGEYPNHEAPWHWHRAVELFYMEKGSIEYITPHGKWTFSEGEGGLVNSNVLHMSRLPENEAANIQILHIFEPELISGEKGNLIEEKYVLPLINNFQTEMIPLYKGRVKDRELLEKIKDSFENNGAEYGYELRLREALSNIWLELLERLENTDSLEESYNKSNEQLKNMMLYIQEHFAESISVKQLANAAYMSERGCYRLFQKCLNETPTEYVKKYRLGIACQILVKTDKPVNEIAVECGFGSNSYFGKLFKIEYGCTPLEYRIKWQNHNIGRQK